MATLKDIAKACNVSVTTVSRIINQDPQFNVSETVRKNVLDTAKNMHYVPRRKINSSAKKNIGLILWHDQKQEEKDPYYLGIRRGIEEASFQLGWTVTVVYKKQGEYDVKHLSLVDGLICIGKFTSAQIATFEKISRHIVFIDSTPNDQLFDSIVIDYHKAVRSALDYLLERRYRAIGYNGGAEIINHNIKLGERRELYFREYLSRNNLLNIDYIHVGEFTVESGYHLMKEAIDKGNYAKAYFCANDNIAFGALRAIYEAKLTVPNDIALIGFNDNPHSAYTYPPLTTIHVPTKLMGQQAVRCLREQWTERIEPIKIIVPTKLVE